MAFVLFCFASLFLFACVRRVVIMHKCNTVSSGICNASLRFLGLGGQLGGPEHLSPPSQAVLWKEIFLSLLSFLLPSFFLKKAKWI